MSEAQLTGVDRLPWLADEARRPQKAAKKRDLLPWAIAVVLLVAAVSFWLGSRASVSQAPQTAAPRATLTLPAPQPVSPPQVAIAPQPQVVQAPIPEIRQAPVPQVRIATPIRKIIREEAARAVAAQERQSVAPPAHKVAASPAPAKAVPYVSPAPWPPRVTAGAYGRLVQIGSYGSVQQAKVGWRYMVRAYPAVAHLPAVVRPDRNSRGRVFYRFRIGTTSQAHSEVLCQRMKRIQLSCAIIGLPWKSKVER